MYLWKSQLSTSMVSPRDVISKFYSLSWWLLRLFRFRSNYSYNTHMYHTDNRMCSYKITLDACWWRCCVGYSSISGMVNSLIRLLMMNLLLARNENATSKWGRKHEMATASYVRSTHSHANCRLDSFIYTHWCNCETGYITYRQYHQNAAAAADDQK